MTVLKKYGFMLGLGSVIAIACILAPTLTGTDDLGGWVVSLATAASVLLIMVVVVLNYLTSRPEFTTSHGVQVWYDGDEELKSIVTKGSIERFYDAVIPVLQQEAKNRCLPIDLIKTTIKQTKLFIWDRPVSTMGIGWIQKDKAGLCSGNNIAVHWLGSWRRTELDHEMLHQFQPLLTARLDPDYKHEDSAWWAVERKLEAAVVRAFPPTGEGV